LLADNLTLTLTLSRRERKLLPPERGRVGNEGKGEFYDWLE
jgi:hypothetical protein